VINNDIDCETFKYVKDRHLVAINRERINTSTNTTIYNKYAEDEIIRFKDIHNARIAHNVELINRKRKLGLVSANTVSTTRTNVLNLKFDYFHIGKLSSVEPLSDILTHIQRNAAVLHKRTFYTVSQSPTSTLISGCDGSTMPTHCNVRAWCNKLYVARAQIMFIMSNLDPTPEQFALECIFAVLILEKYATVALKLPKVLTAHGAGYMTFLCDKFTYSAIISANDGLYIYCTGYQRVEGVVKQSKKLLNVYNTHSCAYMDEFTLAYNEYNKTLLENND
jgi:hypothetical protein